MLRSTEVHPEFFGLSSSSFLSPSSLHHYWGFLSTPLASPSAALLLYSTFDCFSSVFLAISSTSAHLRSLAEALQKPCRRFTSLAEAQWSPQAVRRPASGGEQASGGESGRRERAARAGGESGRRERAATAGGGSGSGRRERAATAGAATAGAARAGAARAAARAGEVCSFWSIEQSR